MRAVLVVLVVLGGSGCIFGVGPYNAASAALLNSDGHGYVRANDQSGVPDGFVRVFSESIQYRRLPAGAHWGVRKGFVEDGDLLQLHVDVNVKIWKFGIGYSRLWTTLDFTHEGLNNTFDGTGNGLRLSFAPVAPLSFDVMLGGGTGDLKTTMKGTNFEMMTPNTSLQHRSFGLTFVPFGIGIWNFGFRFDMNRVEIGGYSQWAPGVDIVVTVL